MLSRRQFVAVVATTGVGAGVGAWLAFRSRGESSRPATPPPPADKTVLGRGTLDALLLVVEALAGMPVEPHHYEAMFEWRAKHVSGQRDLLESFVGFVDDETERLEHRSFAALDRDGRAKLLERVFSPTSTEPPPANVDLELRRTAIARYRNQIIRDILSVFGQTDALVAVGYDGWEGTARGYDNISRPPSPRVGP
jgi:hypothetical protein